MGMPLTDGLIKLPSRTLNVFGCGCILILGARSRDDDLCVLCEACSHLRFLDYLAEHAQEMREREDAPCDAYDDDEPVAYG